tara:strand:- start:331 stop:507 length:177 start_codon:yes stop_codon:yes gene_type:complete
MNQIKVLTATEKNFNVLLNTMLSQGWVMVGQLSTTNLRGIISYSILIAEPKTEEDESK